MSEEQTSLAHDGTAVRERLIEAALRLFTTRGYAATTVREIVEAAGVSKPVLYYYFNSKEGIYLAILECARVSFDAVTAEATAFQGETRERVLHYCELMFSAFLEHIDYARFIFALYFGTPQGAPECDLDYFFDRQLAIVAEMVAEGIDKGELKQLPLQDVAWAIMSIYHTVVEEQICHSSPRLSVNELNRLLSILFDGIAKGVER